MTCRGPTPCPSKASSQASNTQVLALLLGMLGCHSLSHQLWGCQEWHAPTPHQLHLLSQHLTHLAEDQWILGLLALPQTAHTSCFLAHLALVFPIPRPSRVALVPSVSGLALGVESLAMGFMLLLLCKQPHRHHHYRHRRSNPRCR